MFFLVSKIACAGLTFTMILLGSIDHAQAFDFSFSFDDKFGNHPGTTSGTIFDLNDDTNNQFPTSIVIDNTPASLGLSLPLSFTSFSSFFLLGVLMCQEEKFNHLLVCSVHQHQETLTYL